MRRWKKGLLISFLILTTIFSLTYALRMGENAVRLPIGTKIETAGEITRFILPDGVLELIGLAGQLGVRAYNKEGALLYSGKQARLFSVVPVQKLLNQDTSTDDLIFVQFKGLSPQPDPPGKSILIPKGAKIERTKQGSLLFLLANGSKIEIRGQKASQTGIVGDPGLKGECRLYDQRGKLLFSRGQGAICRLIPIQSLRSKVAIDDDIAWAQFTLEPGAR